MHKTLRMFCLFLAIALGGALNLSKAQTTVTFTAGTDKGSDGGTAAKDVSLTKAGITLHATLSSGNAGTFGRTDQYRIYKGATLEVSSTVGNITKVVFTCTASGTANYGPGNFSVPDKGTGAYSSSGTTGTWTGNAASFTLTTSAQVRATKIEVTYTPSGATTKTDPGLSLSATEATATLGEEFTAPTLTNPNNVAVTYSSTEPKVATVDATTGAVTLVAAGNTTIKVDFDGDDNYNAAHLSYNLKVIDPNVVVDEFVKVTDASTLKAGDVLLIVNEDNKAALGAANNNNFGKVTATINNNTATAEGATTVTLGGTEGAWTFNTGSGYLYAAGGSKNNYLKTETTVDDNAKATITISNGDATVKFNGTATRNLLRYNSNSSLFSCYASGQNPIQLYRKNSSTPTLSDVTLTIGQTGYATLYYSDRALKVPENAEAYTYAMLEGELIDNHTYKEGEVIPAGTGVVVFALEAGNYTFTVADATGAFVDNDSQLKGSDTEALTEGGAKYYKLSTKNGANVGFYWGAQDGGAFTSGAHKAYLAVPADQAANAKSGYAFGGDATGIDSVIATKVLDANAPIYNLAGQKVNKDFKGIVIQNGRKFINK